MKSSPRPVNNVPETLFLYKGRSMYPTFSHGDLLVAESVHWKRIQPGDIVLFSKGPSAESNAVCVHRVKRFIAAGMVTKGDNNWGSDPALVQSGQILGRVKWVKKPGQKRLLLVQGGRKGCMVARIRQMETRLHTHLQKTLPKRFHPFLRRHRLQDLLLAAFSYRDDRSNTISQAVLTRDTEIGPSI